MKINWNMIKEKYPKALNKFGEYKTVYKWMIKNGIYVNICYCDLEKFFDENGIIIEICLDIRVNYFNVKKWFYNLFVIDEKQNILCVELNDEDIYFNLRNEAKEQAILKAFEILNKQLETKTK